MEAATGLAGRPGIPGEVEDGPQFDQKRHVSPAGMQEEPIAAPVTRIETLGILLLFGAVYALLGLRLVDLHVVNFDALDRLTRAFMVWHNDPPKLAAIGFSLPPIGTLVLIPFAAVKDLVTSGLALPLSSALFGAGALVFVDRMLAMADMLRPARLMIVLLVGVNPMFAFYAMNGTGDAAHLMFASFGLFCILGWGRNGSARYLIGAGLAFALAVLTRYEYVFWALFLAFMISASLTRKGRDKDEVEGSVIAYLAPIMYTLGIWVFLNAVVLGDPFAWISQAGGSAPVNAVSTPSPDFDLAEAIGNALRVQLIFPVALVALPLLLFNAKARAGIGGGLAALILISIGYSVASAAVAGSVDAIELRNGLPTMIAGCAGIAWVYLRAEASRAMIWGLTIGVGIVAIPLASSQMQSFPHQNLEQAFTRAIASGEDQEGTTSRGGVVVGISPETSMAELHRRAGAGSEPHPHRQRPDVWGDRPDRPARALLRSRRPRRHRVAVRARNPQGKVDYMLVDRTEADLILDKYPGADAGDVPGLDPVVSNERYALIRVDESAPITDAGAPSTAAPPAADGRLLLVRRARRRSPRNAVRISWAPISGEPRTTPRS